MARSVHIYTVTNTRENRHQQEDTRNATNLATIGCATSCHTTASGRAAHTPTGTSSSNTYCTQLCTRRPHGVSHKKQPGDGAGASAQKTTATNALIVPTAHTTQPRIWSRTWGVPLLNHSSRHSRRRHGHLPRPRPRPRPPRAAELLPYSFSCDVNIFSFFTSCFCTDASSSSRSLRSSSLSFAHSSSFFRLASAWHVTQPPPRRR